MFKELSKKLAESARIGWYEGQAAEETWIEDAERELGLSLPASYKWWLRTYGNGQIDGSEIYSLAPPEFRDDADTDIVYMRRLDRASGLYPENRLYFYRPSPEEAFYFALDAESGAGELPVWREDRLGGDDEVFAASFAEFLDKMA
ncbi:SMI1/KNR4 family protein [Paenibacillus sp. GYB003]|uniref:SMI1/KNR4 family protein n=1 Tax=Paenibacillus sp. GYB003 TaxID=2994392 RepID=UPI002F96DF73